MRSWRARSTGLASTSTRSPVDGRASDTDAVDSSGLGQSSAAGVDVVTGGIVEVDGDKTVVELVAVELVVLDAVVDVELGDGNVVEVVGTVVVVVVVVTSARVVVVVGADVVDVVGPVVVVVS